MNVISGTRQGNKSRKTGKEFREQIYKLSDAIIVIAKVEYPELVKEEHGLAIAVAKILANKELLHRAILMTKNMVDKL